jgi:hypothetical protein
MPPKETYFHHASSDHKVGMLCTGGCIMFREQV